MDKLQEIINERPMFHRGETEIDRPFLKGESMLSNNTIEKLEKEALTCYGIGKDVLAFIADNIQKGTKTLETGAGCSTLVFAFCGADHTAVTPSLSEINLITKYAVAHGISMDKVKFIQESSDYFLPRCKEGEFDLILLDGKHAFPWPIVDWFYTADKLKQGGLMIIDDAEMRSVSILVDFMKVDTGWLLVADFSGKTIVFRKRRTSIHDVAWHMQPYTVSRPFSKIKNRIKNLFKG
jgi:Methyltransferase domain